MKNSSRKKMLYNIIAVSAAAILLFPLVWIILNSFKSNTEMFVRPISLLPKEFSVEGYLTLLKDHHVLRSAVNSAVFAFGALLIGLCLGVPAAYGLARYRVRGTKAVLFLFLVTQLMPASVILTPLFMIFNKLHLLNTYLAPILSVATISVPFVVITTRPYFLSLPLELEEAARIDGCNAFKAFLLVILPVARSGLITASCIAFIYGWNDLIFSMTFITNDKLRPLTNLFYMLMPVEGIEWSAIMALATIVVLPIIILFVSLQKFIVSGLTSGAVKS